MPFYFTNPKNKADALQRILAEKSSPDLYGKVDEKKIKKYMDQFDITEGDIKEAEKKERERRDEEQRKREYEEQERDYYGGIKSKKSKK